ncbi:MAG: dioxygenase family protein [Pseudomonadota bacterium]
MPDRPNSARRHLLTRALAAGVLVAWRGAAPSFAQALIATPRQGAGPFYPRELPLERDNDLASVAGSPAPARGQIAHVFGRVRDAAGRPVAGARVEIWQCNAFGRYHHPADRRDAPLDPGFQGYGETVSAADGAYRFRTIRPVPYPGRTPHIHFAVTTPDGRLITQMYVEGEPGNERDFVLNGVRDPAMRAAVIVALAPASHIEAGALTGMFDILLGRNAG